MSGAERILRWAAIIAGASGAVYAVARIYRAEHPATGGQIALAAGLAASAYILMVAAIVVAVYGRDR